MIGNGATRKTNLTVTPIGGFGWPVLEDFVDKNLIQMIERRSSGNFYIKIASRRSLTRRVPLQIYCDLKRHGIATEGCGDGMKVGTKTEERLSEYAGATG